jgi:glycogen(starch) synthase
LQQLAASLGIASRVDFRGALDNGQTQLAMRTAWAVCVPSVWEEPFGVVAVEAQMNGVPVIASRCGGLPEIVSPDSGGILVAPGDGNALASAMVSLGADRAGLLARGKSAHTFAMRHFRISKFADHFEELYSALVQAAR